MHPVVPELRRLALAVTVLHDVDLLPDDDGLTLTSGPSRAGVSWSWVGRIVAGSDEQPGRIERLATWLRCRIALLHGEHLHARGLTAADAPALAWIRERVPGGALLLGFGYGDGREPVPDGVLAHAGIDADVAWRSVRQELESTGALAAGIDRRRRHGALRPVGGADVVTLLGSRALRAEIAAGEGDGLAVLVVPLRVRGWRATAVSDPVFAPALAAAMPAEERGYSRPLLVSAHEVNEVTGRRGGTRAPAG